MDISTTAATPGSAASDNKIGQRKLLILLAIGFAPMIAAWALYLSHWQPTSVSANGQLVTPILTESQWWLADQHPEALATLKGHWLIVEVLPEDCALECQQQAQNLTQMHMALGKEASRVRRLWLGDIKGNSEDPYLTVLPKPALAIPNNSQRFIVDPLGNLVLTYQPDQDLRQLMKDLKRLLKASSIG